MTFSTAISGINAANSDLGVISNNIANANTPGYQRLDVSFDQQLLQARHREKQGKLAPKIIEANDDVARADGNTVDIDQELGHLNRNAMLFQMYNQLLTKHLDTMRQAIG